MKLTTSCILGLASAVAIAAPALAQSSANPPALVVLVAVDQFRGDYLDRFGAQLTGGLARFRTQSAFFPHSWQDHAITETAPGHSTMLSGREPWRTGIVSNNRGVPDETSPLIGASGTGASPKRFVGTALYDWMLAKDPTTRVFSVSRKDRGAILPVGRAKAPIFWFTNGKFTTSRYYADTLPSWVTAFNDSIHLERLAGRKWDLLLPANQYSEPDSVPYEHGRRDFVFPHQMPGADRIAGGIADFPWMDSLTLAFALDGVHTLKLGRRGTVRAGTMPDLLTISLSTTDAVGHAYGPDSREIHDQVVRLDRWLGSFMSDLEKELGTNRIVWVLTADHGVNPVDPNQKGAALADIARSMSDSLRAKYQTNFGLEFDTGVFFADVTAMRERGINIDSLSDAIVAAGSGRPGVHAGFTPKTLATSNDSGAVRWRRTLAPSIGWLAAFVVQPGYLWGGDGLRTSADHGTPTPLGRLVPIAFMGPGIAKGRHEGLARTVDIAPTLAELLGIKPLEELDGHPLREALAKTGR